MTVFTHYEKLIKGAYKSQSPQFGTDDRCSVSLKLLSLPWHPLVSESLWGPDAKALLTSDEFRQPRGTSLLLTENRACLPAGKYLHPRWPPPKARKPTKNLLGNEPIVGHIWMAVINRIFLPIEHSALLLVDDCLSCHNKINMVALKKVDQKLYTPVWRLNHSLRPFKYQKDVGNFAPVKIFRHFKKDGLTDRFYVSSAHLLGFEPCSDTAWKWSRMHKESPQIGDNFRRIVKKEIVNF